MINYVTIRWLFMILQVQNFWTHSLDGVGWIHGRSKTEGETGKWDATAFQRFSAYPQDAPPDMYVPLSDLWVMFIVDPYDCFYTITTLPCVWSLAHPTKGHCDESRPELVLRLTVGSLCLSVLHIDPLPPPDSSRSPLAPMASEFFRILSVNQLSAGSFLQSRTVFDEACPHDHLR